jgi:Flp pilus assembly pilin Flp
MDGPAARRCADMAFYRWVDRIRSRWSRSEGQTMAEYGLVLAIITPAIILGYALLSDDIAAVFDAIRGLF